MKFLFPIIAAILGRMAGGGLWANKVPSFIPEILPTFFIGFVTYERTTNVWLSCLAWAWGYLWYQTGHGTAFSMGRNRKTALTRKQTLSCVIDPLCRAFQKPLGGKFYCWAFMGLKGLLLSLPLYPYGLILAILWPLSYEISWRVKERGWMKSGTELGEYLSGAFLGLIISLS